VLGARQDLQANGGLEAAKNFKKNLLIIMITTPNDKEPQNCKTVFLSQMAVFEVGKHENCPLLVRCPDSRLIAPPPLPSKSIYILKR
jgi:hypothetical protein